MSDWAESYVRVNPALKDAERALRMGDGEAARRPLIDAIAALCETLAATTKVDR